MEVEVEVEVEVGGICHFYTYVFQVLLAGGHRGPVIEVLTSNHSSSLPLTRFHVVPCASRVSSWVVKMTKTTYSSYTSSSSPGMLAGQDEGHSKHTDNRKLTFVFSHSRCYPW
jgi:hypothetical protein